jgi:hypothetical protein
MLPKFVYDGGSPRQFVKNFPLVAAFFKVAEVYEWEPSRALGDAEKELDARAMVVLRQYVSEDVFEVISVGAADRASLLYSNLKQMFLRNDARVKLQIHSELHGATMRPGETILSFIGRLSALMNELDVMGEQLPNELRTLMMVTKLREPWRTIAGSKLEREPEATFSDMVGYLLLKVRGEESMVGVDTAVFMAESKGTVHTSTNRTGQRAKQGGKRCTKCGQHGHWKSVCTNPVKCFNCNRDGHMS